MMFTPLVFIIYNKDSDSFPINIFALVLVVTSLILLLKWEIIYHRHKERFSDTTNLSIRCENCHEKLCQHKKQLQKLLQKSRELIRQKLKLKDKENK